MNPISNLLGRATRTEDDVVLTEEQLAEKAAADKADRAKFHRDHVRNGPQGWKSRTVGQQRRAVARDKAASERKTNRRHRRNFIERNARIAALRGQLQAAGTLSYAQADFTPALEIRKRATIDLVAAFGERDDVGELVIHDRLVPAALGAALEEYHRLIGKR